MKKFLAIAMGMVICTGVLAGCSKEKEEKPALDTSYVELAETGEDTEEPSEVTIGDPDKKAILVVSFGTSYADTRAKTIEAIESDIADAFPDYEVKRAFTSQMIIKKLAERDGLEIDDVATAMEKLISDGVGTLVIQPTHVMHGSEYDEMMEQTSMYAENFVSLTYGRPLLSLTSDYEKVAQAIVDEYGVNDLDADTALVLMGHGTYHFANSTYSALDYMFKDMGYPNIFVGTVEGYPELDSVIKGLNVGEYNKVVMAPLMIVAGDHAENDMAGDEDDSWKVMLKADGIEAEPILKGMGEIQAVRDLYISHIEDAIEGDIE